jgi:excisionase family DNA binding protein
MAENLTTREVAKLLRLSEEAVRRQIRSGKIRAAKVGRQWLVPGAEVIRILAVKE